MPYDTGNDHIIREFDGATASQKPNGIGVLLMRYPVNVSRSVLNDTTHRADLDYYSTMWPDGNAMYWWAYSVGYNELGESELADTYFAKVTAKNVFGPFKIWSEAPGGGGCPNFVTGAGAYLQAVWAGYVGLRFSDDALHLIAPRAPPTAHRLVLRGVNYAGAMIDIAVSNATRGANLTLSEGSSSNRLLVAVDDAAGEPLIVGCVIIIPPGSHARVFMPVDSARRIVAAGARAV
jgi:hypothetical protein